ncbi:MULTISPECIES: DNA alkylation repair protein [unclassified Clostridium]|uniref:DNA alkylation repair protein n=1 Tax=unclassified Clostridium TaxID=2614128 RepID=UPI0025BA17AB|nr:MULTISPECIES: DNA alkylation repair protein [unclassified Clostridium]
MTKDEVMIYLKEHGNEQTKKIYLSHGAKEPLYGVKLGDLKLLKKKIKTNHNLALELYNTGNSDAMYLAGLIEDPKEVSIEQMDEWIKAANWDMLSDRCVAVVAAKTPFGFEIARKWLNSSEELIVCAGYAIYCTLFTILDDNEIDLEEVKNILNKIANNIHNEKIRLQNSMNNFVIMAGIYIKPLHEFALEIAERIGKIDPVIAKNSCNTQTVAEYLKKYAEKGKIGIKIKNLGR